MSRVADALRLANLERPGADAFTGQGHPWGRDLEADDGPRIASTAAPTRARRPEVDEAAGITEGSGPADAAREPAILEGISPLNGLPSSIRQQIAGVVERVFLTGSGEGPRMVGFAGIDADAQSGWVAAAVADLLAQRTAARIAVVDMNFTNPRLHECFGISRTSGRLAVIGSDTPFSRAREVQANLSVIPAGDPVDASELTPDTRARISRLATAYDHVIVCLEPLAGWCGGGLPTMVDGIVLVVAADASRRQTGRKVAERLQASGTAILGAVLTNRRYAIPEAIYKRL